MNLPIVSRQVLNAAELRLQSLSLEYQNYRRRTEAVREASYQNGRNDAARQFLPVYDDLLRALQQPCQDEAYVKGIEMTRKALLGVLSGLGITEIPALGESFDPALHEALEHIVDISVGENTITQVALTGFRQGNTVLRHALVIVAN